MADKTGKKSTLKSAADIRESRRAQALKANLRRRKATSAPLKDED